MFSFFKPPIYNQILKDLKKYKEVVNIIETTITNKPYSPERFALKQLLEVELEDLTFVMYKKIQQLSKQKQKQLATVEFFQPTLLSITNSNYYFSEYNAQLYYVSAKCKRNFIVTNSNNIYSSSKYKEYVQLKFTELLWKTPFITPDTINSIAKEALQGNFYIRHHITYLCALPFNKHFTSIKDIQWLP